MYTSPMSKIDRMKKEFVQKEKTPSEEERVFSFIAYEIYIFI